jgi:hypothetical protein
MNLTPYIDRLQANKGIVTALLQNINRQLGNRTRLCLA